MLRSSEVRTTVLLVAALCGVAVATGGEVVVKEPEKSIPYGPIPAVATVGMSLAGGMMLKEGCPYFWIGQGDGPGASQQGPAGLWLAWLQGADGVTLNNGMKMSVAANGAGLVTVAPETDIGIQSWRREAVRLGLLTDFFHGGNSSMKVLSHPVVKSNAELAEAICPYGHYLPVDSGNPLGRKINVARRKAVSDYLMDQPDTGYMELCREPGPNPTNRRAYKVFRAFAKRKYGTLAEADAVWGTRHASWEDVVPPHLDDRLKHARGSSEVALRRMFVRGRYRAFYRDWIAAIQCDVTAWVKGEIEALHSVAPGVAFTIDVRGHTNQRHDSYPMLVPEDIDGAEDLFSLHQGTYSFTYGGRPADAESVVLSTSFPLFNMNYFRVNARGALVNAEDIISIARAPVADAGRMKANCLGQITDCEWDFRTDPQDEGMRERWFEPGTGVSGWGTVHVPGAWDLQDTGRGYSGVAWYRKRFKVDGGFAQDHDDGSRIFRLRGNGVAQSGTAWLNGVRVGDVNGWSTPYSFDVGGLLKYGGENTLVWRIDGQGKSENGLRFDTYILPDDLVSKEEPFNERQFRRMAFNQLFEGLSGVFVWHWHDDALRTYQPKLHAQLQTVAGQFLPHLRRRQRGRVAYLYSYNNQPGLPMQSEGTYRGFGDLQCALDFVGHKPDIFGERRFREKVTPKRYPFLFVPRLPTVEDETYEHFKRYVRSGGVAVITEGSLAETSSRYAPTDIATFDRGQGRVVVLHEPLELTKLMDSLPELLPAPEVGVEARDAGTAAERPLFERILTGSEDHKVLYLCNWGGIDREVLVSLPGDIAGWNVTDVVGAFRRESDGRLAVRVPSQDVAVAIFDRPGRGRTAVKRPSPHRMAKLRELEALISNAVPAESCDVLFMRCYKRRGGFRMGPELLPDWLQAVRKLGLTYGWSDPAKWTAETLKGRRVVVLTESNSNAFFSRDFTPELKKALVEYVRGGGSLFLATCQNGTTNIDGLLLRNPGCLGSAFGIAKDGKCGFVRGGAHTAFGDPFQHFSPVADKTDGMTDGVGEVLVNVTCALAFPNIDNGSPSPAFPVVCAPADAAVGSGRPVMAAARFGSGRVFVCGDITAFVPFRIGHAGNAALLLNAFGWLANRPVDAAGREAFARSPFLTEADLRKIKQEENK